MLTFHRYRISAAWFVFLAVTVGGCDGRPAQEGDNSNKTTEKWVSDLPVSLTGQEPEHLPHKWTEEHWHDLFVNYSSRQARKNMKAAEYFDEPNVARLCDAIFNKNIAEIQRLIDAGVDVNSVGKNRMTPLYWALFVDDDPRPFGELLKNGADPNVASQDRELNGFAGYTVVHHAVSSTYFRHFRNVFEMGNGDPNLRLDIEILRTSTPAICLLNEKAPDAIERLELLVAKGGNLNAQYKNGGTLIYRLVAQGNEKACQLAIAAIQAGADPKLYFQPKYHHSDPNRPYEECHFRLIHVLAVAEPEVNQRPAKQQVYYRALIELLEQRGEALDDAKRDLERWAEWVRGGNSDAIEAEFNNRKQR